MWQPKRILIKALMTHLETEYELIRNKCVLIFGINDTDSGADSNGSGKSTVIEGITLAITGQTCRDVTKDDFIMDGEEESFIEFELDNKTGNINNLVIKRWFYKKKSAKIEIWENGEQNKEITSVNEANQRIYELIGLTREDLLHFFIVGQDTNFSFLTSNDTNKKDIISRLSNTDNILRVIDNLKKQKTIVESGKFKTLNQQKIKVETKLEILNSEYDDLKADKSDTIKERICEIDEDISDLKECIESNENLIKKYNKQIKEKEKESEEIIVDDESLKELQKKETKYDSDLKKLREDLRKTDSTVNHLKMIKAGALNCPKCNHAFNPSEDVDIDVSEVDELIEFSEEEVSELNRKISKIKSKVKKVEIDIESSKKSIEDKEDIESEIKRIERTKKGLINEDNVSLKTISELEESKIKLTKQSDKKQKIRDKKIEINELEKELNIVQVKIDEEQTEIDMIDFWIHNFGKKGFTTFLSNKSVKVIEGVTNSFLKKFNSDLQVQIDGFTILKSGDLSEKINVSIVRNGKNIGSYKRYSGGEKGRINLANIVGLQKLMNMSANNGGLNLLALDEVFDGLDTTGQRDVIGILESIGVTTLVVSHRNEPIGSENEIFVRKTDNISTIEKRM